MRDACLSARLEFLILVRILGPLTSVSQETRGVSPSSPSRLREQLRVSREKPLGVATPLIRGYDAVAFRGGSSTPEKRRPRMFSTLPSTR